MADCYPVAGRPCGSCPMRADAPPGLWSPEEYAKLPPYDRPTGEQPFRLFMCHQNDGHLCAGWVAVGGGELLALRIAVLTGEADRSVFDYSTPVPLHASFTASADHGLAGVDAPPPETRRVAERLVRKGGSHRHADPLDCD